MVDKLLADTLEEEVTESKGATLQELHFYGKALNSRGAMLLTPLLSPMPRIW